MVGCCGEGPLTQSSSEDEDGHGLPNAKLKNELCINYLRYGFCRYNSKCQFAHGIEELLQNQKHNIKYKTKKCNSFFEKGFCPYGERCNFLHIEDRPQPISLPSYREVVLNSKQHSSLFAFPWLICSKLIIWRLWYLSYPSII